MIRRSKGIDVDEQFDVARSTLKERGDGLPCLAPPCSGDRILEISASALEASAFSIRSDRSPGTNSSERNLMTDTFG